MSEHEQIGDLPHLRIQTEAGKEFWSYMNNNYGSSVWGRVGDGILAVEAEMRERLAEAWEEGAQSVTLTTYEEDGEVFTKFVEQPNPYREGTE